MESLQRQFITLAELSLRVGVSTSTLRRWVRNHRLPAVQPGGPGGKLLFPADLADRVLSQLSLAQEGDRSDHRQGRLPGRQPVWMRPS